jgi:hypothetical protein
VVTATIDGEGIKKQTKAEENILEVEVVNMWVNRLIDDSKLPDDKRLTRTNVKKFEADDAGKYLRKSGLIGDVNLDGVIMVDLK